MSSGRVPTGHDGSAGGPHADVLIVGASLAGISTAEALRAAGFAGSIVLIGEEEGLPYSRPPLSKQVLEGEWGPERAVLRSAEELRDLDLELVTARALGLDVLRRRVRTTEGTWSFDQVVIATGARAVRPGGLDGAEEAVLLRTREDAVRLRVELGEARSVAVVGSGVLASEIASAARGVGCEVVLLGRSGQLSLGALGTRLHDRLSRLHRRHGVQLRLLAPLRGLLPAGRTGTRLLLDQGEELHADLVVAAVGAMPATEWLHGSGLEGADGVLCDAQGRAAPGVFAVGDAARWSDPRGRPARRSGHQSGAIEQAHRVAGSILGHTPTSSSPPLPFFWSRIHGTRIQVYGAFPAEDRLDTLEDGEGRTVLASLDERTGQVHGVVGWNAPRGFRRARLLVDRDHHAETSVEPEAPSIVAAPAAVPQETS